MGISADFFNSLNRQNKTQADTSGISPEFFGALSTEPQRQEQPGLFKHMYNVLRDFNDILEAQNAANPSKALLYKHGITPDTSNVNPEAAKAVANAKTPNLELLKNDFKNFLGAGWDLLQFGNPVARQRNIARIGGEAQALGEGFKELAGGVGTAISQEGIVGGTAAVAGGFASVVGDIFITSPLETISGARLGNPEGLRALTPEEYNKSIKTTAGAVAGIIIGAAARQAVANKSLTGIDDLVGGNLRLSNTVQDAIGNLQAVPTRNLAELAQGLGENKFGALGRKIKAGIAEGVIGGAAQSGIENLGEDGMAAKMVTDALLGASIGPLFELVLPGDAPGRVGVWTPEEAKQLGRQAFAAKQLKIGLDELTREDGVEQLLRRTEFVLEGDDLVDAMLRLEGDRIRQHGYAIFNDVSRAKEQELVAKFNEQTQRFQDIRTKIMDEEYKKQTEILKQNNQLNFGADVKYDPALNIHTPERFREFAAKILDPNDIEFDKLVTEAWDGWQKLLNVEASYNDFPSMLDLRSTLNEVVREAKVKSGGSVWISGNEVDEAITKALGYTGGPGYVNRYMGEAKAVAAIHDLKSKEATYRVVRSRVNSRVMILDRRSEAPNSLDELFFKNHGLIREELVHYAGYDWIVDPDTPHMPGQVTLREVKTGKKRYVATGDPDVKPIHGEPGTFEYLTTESLKRKFFEQYASTSDVNATPLAQQAMKYFHDYIFSKLQAEKNTTGKLQTTVENVAPIVFRGHSVKGQVIPGTGVFYSTKAGIAKSYANLRSGKYRGQLDPKRFTIARLLFKKMFVMEHGAWQFGKNLENGDMMGLTGITPEEIKALRQAEDARSRNTDENAKLPPGVAQDDGGYLQKADIGIQGAHKRAREIYQEFVDQYNGNISSGFDADTSFSIAKEYVIQRSGASPSWFADEQWKVLGQWPAMTEEARLQWMRDTILNHYIYDYATNNRGKTHSESGYQLRDKIIARILKRNGYDGYIKSIGPKADDSIELVDLREDRRVVAVDYENKRTLERNVKFQLPEQQASIEAVRKLNYEAGEQLVDRFTEFLEKRGWLTDEDPEPFRALVNDFASQYNILPEEIQNFENAIQRKLLDKLLKESLPDEEFKRWNAAHVDVLQRKVESDKKHKEGLVNNAKRLRKLAATAGMYLDTTDYGTFTLRDWKTHKRLGYFDNALAAETFIRESGVDLSSVDLLFGRTGRDGGIVPPDGVVSGLFDPGDNWGNDNFSQPFAYKEGWWQEFRNFVNTTSFGKYFSELPRRLRAFDAMFGTSLHARVFEPIQTARSAEIAQKITWLRRLEAIDKVARDLTADQREQIFHYIETMSPDELIHRGIQSRQMTQTEVQLAQNFHQWGVNDVMVMAMRKELRPYVRALLKGTIDKQMYLLESRRIATELGAGPEDLKALDMIDDVLMTGAKQSEFSLGAVMRLFRAYGDPNAVPRDIYAQRFNMSGKQLAVAKMLDNYFAEIVKLSGVEDRQLLNGYITHARRYENNNLSGAISDFMRIDPETRKFYAKMARTGELSAIETDPIKAALRYTNALFRTQHTERAITQALYEARRQLRGLTNQDVRKTLKTEIASYIEGVRGYPELADRTAQSTFEVFWERVFGNKAPELRRELVNTSLNVFELGIQGFRVKAGLLDVFSNLALTYAEKGTERTLKTIRLGLDAVKSGKIHELRNRGVVPPELMALFFSDPEGEAAKGLSGRIKRTEAGISQLADVGLKFSGQKHVYAVMQVGTYLENWNHASEWLMKLGTGKADKQKAYSELNLQRYGKSAVTEFDRLVQLGDTQKAADFYAKVARDASQKVYGLARNPAWMQRNLGRMVGQFSAWPIWFRSAFLDGISRGTAKQRIAYAARYGIAISTLAVLGEEFEMDFSNWMPHNGMMPTGGPAFQVATDIVNAMTSTYGPEQSASANRLMKLVPSISEDGELNIGPLIPGGIALNDLIEARQVADEGFDNPAVFARMFGIQANTQDKTALGQMLGIYNWWEQD